MSETSSGPLLQLVRRSAGDPAPGCTDAELLRRFTTERDGAAFEAVLRRHGPMVLDVCRSVLSNEADAEDAFQASFLVLARASSSIRKGGSLAAWLHGVARRVALKARAGAARRQVTRGAVAEAGAAVAPGASGAEELSWREVRAILHEELAALPERVRGPLVLCYLEGRTHEEAAALLGFSKGTLRRRLERGRALLRARLAGRGLGAAVALAAAWPAAVAAGVRRDAVAPLVQVATGAGRGAVPGVSPAAVALAEGALGTMSLAKLRAVVIALAGVAVVGVAVALGMEMGALGSRLAVQPPDKAQPKTPDQPSAARQIPLADDTTGSAAYAGRVLDPDGKPVAGAKLYVLYSTPKALPVPERGTSDKDGNFRFSVEKKDFDRSDSPRPWSAATLVAVADGYGLGFPVSQPGQPTWPVHSPTELTFRLPKDDAPVTGRVLDLQGRPVAGATVNVHAVLRPGAGGDLTDWLAELKKQRAGYPAIRKFLTGPEGEWMGRDVGRIFHPVVTDKDGRFRLKGVGRERLVALRIEGPTIACTDLWAMTRPGDKFQAAVWTRVKGGPEMTFVGADFEHHVAPGRPIVGTVRDKDTGKPIPGAVVQSDAFAGTNFNGDARLRAVADKEGRYRLFGMPKGEGNRVRVSPPEGEPYLTALARAPDTAGLEPVTVDVQLKRGLWITGKVTDKATGKPVHSTIKYTLFADNPNRLEAPGLTFDEYTQTKAEDGTFRFVGLPGRAAVSAWGSQPGYLTGVGVDRIKDFDLVSTNIGRAFHTIVAVNPEKGAESVACEIVLEPGRTLNVAVLDPAGKPLAAAHVRGLRGPSSWDSPPVKTTEFTVSGLRPDEERLLQFVDAEKKLAGSLVVKGDAKGPVRVTLGPAGTLTGRLVTADGKPLADVELMPLGAQTVPDPRARSKPDLTAGSFPPGIRTDADGKFRIAGLAPGLTYRATLTDGKALLRAEGDLEKGVTVKAGETKELGDIKVKLPDQ